MTHSDVVKELTKLGYKPVDKRKEKIVKVLVGGGAWWTDGSAVFKGPPPAKLSKSLDIEFDPGRAGAAVAAWLKGAEKAKPLELVGLYDEGDKVELSGGYAMRSLDFITVDSMTEEPPTIAMDSENPSFVYIIDERKRVVGMCAVAKIEQ